MAKDKGQRTYEEHAFLMWHSHQIHHSRLSGMPMMLSSLSNYTETMQQYECKPWRANLRLTWWSLNGSSHFNTCELTTDVAIEFDERNNVFAEYINYMKTPVGYNVKQNKNALQFKNHQFNISLWASCQKTCVLIVNNTGCTLFTLFMEHDILVNAFLTELTFMLLQICWPLIRDHYLSPEMSPKTER